MKHNTNDHAYIIVKDCQSVCLSVCLSVRVSADRGIRVPWPHLHFFFMISNNKDEHLFF